MSLPIKPVYPPMEAVSADEFPSGEQWQYEPKWDGFRCIAFLDGNNVELQSKSGRPLARYFPDMVEQLRDLTAKKFVVDGELVIEVEGAISFEELQLRLHPAESRVRKLAAAHPASFIIFDLLVDEKGKLLAGEPLAARRKALEKFAGKYLKKNAHVRLSLMTTDLKEARKWFAITGGGLDGVVAKDRTMEYRSGERAGMRKIKNIRTADCVVGGFRYGTKDKLAASLLLGLYDENGLLNHVGFSSGIKRQEREALTKKLEALAKKAKAGDGFTGDAPGGPSRWSTERSAEWTPLPPKLVVEVEYDHFSGGRFRHGTGFVRWRPDKAPKMCRYDQIPASGDGMMKLVK